MVEPQEVVQQHKATFTQALPALIERDVKSFKRSHKPGVGVSGFAGPDSGGSTMSWSTRWR